MFRWKSWSIKKAECWRIDPFDLWCWRRLLRVPWTVRRSNQSILKEISPEYSLKGLMLKLKLQYFGHLIGEPTHCKRHWCWERLKAGREQGNRGWDGWMASLTWWTWVWGSLGVGDGQESLACCNPWGTKIWTWLSNWTEREDLEIKTNLKVSPPKVIFPLHFDKARFKCEIRKIVAFRCY